MKKFRFFFAISFLMAVFSYSAAYADALSCSGGIISNGDRNTDVIAKCGPPDFRDSHQEEVIQRLDSNTKQKIIINVEEWTYNFGPNQLTRIVVLQNGVVYEIRTGNYGYTRK